jgi:hypothetical protein
LLSGIRKLKLFFRKAPLDCEYVYNILNEIFCFIDVDKHISALLKHQKLLRQDMGAWSEFFEFSAGNEAPLATAEAVLALSEFAVKSDVRSALKRACKFLIESQQEDGGWADLSGGYSVNDATGCVIAALSEAKKSNIINVPDENLKNAVDFLISQQNTDGGWGVTKGEESKMHYTFFAIVGLAKYSYMFSNQKFANKALKKGIRWILKNSRKNNEKGVGLSMNLPPTPVATALAILCMHEAGEMKKVSPRWVRFLKESQTNGQWNEISDSATVHGVRRTYDFRSIPWIVEALVRTNEPLDSEIIRKALHELKKYERGSGGFVRDPGGANPVVWFTAWVIRMMTFLRRELSDNLRIYVDRTIKNAKEVHRKLENYKLELNLEKKFMIGFASSNLILILLTTCLLYFMTHRQFGRIIWHSFFVTSFLLLEIAIAYYWNKRIQLNKFRGFFLAIIFTAVNILLGFIS